MTLNDRRRALFMRKHRGGRLPSEYQEVEYIQSHGEEFIDTLFVADSASGVTVKFQYTDSSGLSVFGGEEAFGSNAFHLYGDKSNFDVGYGTFHISSAGGWRFGIGVTYIFQLNNGNASIFSDEMEMIYNQSFSTRTLAAPVATTLFGVSRPSYQSKGKLKIMEAVFTSDNIPNRHFVPCYRKSDGVIGMYDLCGSICPLTDTPFYINSGTGAFTKGADV